MKRFILVLSIILTVGFYNMTQAQINVNVNINSQPAWGPTGYDCVDFYYFPDLNIYFDVNNSLFYYPSGSKWLSNRYLPNKYSKYDLYDTYKVVIDDHSNPWYQNNSHKKQYSSFKNNNKQTAIRNSNDSRYNQSKKNTIEWVDRSKNNSNKANNKSSKKVNNNNSQQKKVYN